MTEQELRALVRQAIARAGVERILDATPGVATRAVSRAAADAGYSMFALPDGSDADGPCIIEPAVTCSHCGFCKSLGH